MPATGPCASLGAAFATDSIVLAVPTHRARQLIARLVSSDPIEDCQGTTRPSPPAYREPERLDTTRRVLVPADTTLPVLIVWPYPASVDARDLIDREVDLVITEAPAAIDYAVTRGALRTAPLAWSTTYALAFDGVGAPPVEVGDARRDELARDAVRADARPAARPVWWDDPPCRVQPNTPVVRLPGIAIAGTDPIARALAERLVALAASAALRRVVSLSPAQLDSVARRGTATAFVIGLPDRRPPNCEGIPPLPVGWALVPLVQIRATAIAGPRVPSFVILGDGSLVFSPARP